MTANLKRDLEHLSRLAFRRAEKGHQLVREFCSLSKRVQKHPDYPLLENFYPWLLVPLTLWAVDLDGFGRHLLKLIKTGLRFDAKTKLLLAQLTIHVGQRVAEIHLRLAGPMQQRHEHLLSLLGQFPHRILDHGIAARELYVRPEGMSLGSYASAR